MRNPLVLKNVNKTLSILRSSEDKLIMNFNYFHTSIQYIFTKNFYFL